MYISKELDPSILLFVRINSAVVVSITFTLVASIIIVSTIVFTIHVHHITNPLPLLVPP